MNEVYKAVLNDLGKCHCGERLLNALEKHGDKFVPVKVCPINHDEAEEDDSHDAIWDRVDMYINEQKGK